MINYTKLPEHIRGGMQRWIEHGIKPGNFLQAVIRNDLVDSFGQADEINLAAIFDIVEFMYNEAPGNCWITKENIKNWEGTKKEATV